LAIPVPRKMVLCDEMAALTYISTVSCKCILLQNEIE
jgi:hypothetical protein